MVKNRIEKLKKNKNEKVYGKENESVGLRILLNK
jgi:hypothetical protein